MTIVNDSANEIIRKSTRVIRPDDYRLMVDVDNIALTPFNECKFVTRTVQLELKSNVGTVSRLRNYITITGDGDVEINESGEYRTFTNAATSARTTFESGGRGRYIPGYELECGIGVRIPSQTLTGTQKIEWGYLDSDDGIGYGLDATGFYVFIKRLGVTTKKVYQSAFNQDTVDGSNTSLNPSGKTLNLSDGNIFQLNFVWYGYGTVKWFVVLRNQNNNGSNLVMIHQENTQGTTSISQPNLPVTLEVSNGNSSTAIEAFVGGRQVSIYGQDSKQSRINGDYVLAKSAPAGSWTPMVSFRRKSGRGANQTVRLDNVELITSQDLIYTFVSNGTLSGGSFDALTNVSVNETVIESNIGASAITGGVFLGGYSFATSTRANASQSNRLANLNFEFVNSDIVSLVVRPLTSTASVQAILDVQEQW